MYDTEITFVVHESAEGGFEAHAIGHSIFTQAETLEELKAMIRDAINCHFEEGSRPSLIQLQ
jgi:predicted RNase H-like HicB family nuclease